LARQRGLSLSLQDLFRYQTIRTLAAIATPPDAAPAELHTTPFTLVSETDRSLLPDDLEDAYPLSQLQAGMLYHMQLAPEAHHYHNVDSYSLDLDASFDLEKFRVAAQRIAGRHAVLRTSFDMVRYGEPLQLVHRAVGLEVGYFDIRHMPSAEQAAIILAFVDQEQKHSFDMEVAPLLRLNVHQRAESQVQFTITDFHPIVDGWSLHTIMKELFEAYSTFSAGRSLPEPVAPASTFRDFVALERAT